MTREKKKEEAEKVEFVPPTSQTDLDSRLDEDYVPGTALPNAHVQPNPFGAEDYAGTDPIYQNYGNDTSKPLRAEEGPDKKAEDVVRELHDLDDVDESELVPDYGQGGKSRMAHPNQNAGATAYLVPGQEGYDKQKAEEQNGPPMRVDTAGGDDDEEVQAPPPPDPEDPTGAAVNPSGAQKDPGDE